MPPRRSARRLPRAYRPCLLGPRRCPIDCRSCTRRSNGDRGNAAARGGARAAAAASRGAATCGGAFARPRGGGGTMPRSPWMSSVFFPPSRSGGRVLAGRRGASVEVCCPSPKGACAARLLCQPRLLIDRTVTGGGLRRPVGLGAVGKAHAGECSRAAGKSDTAECSGEYGVRLAMPPPFRSSSGAASIRGAATATTGRLCDRRRRGERALRPQRAPTPERVCRRGRRPVTGCVAGFVAVGTRRDRRAREKRWRTLRFRCSEPPRRVDLRTIAFFGTRKHQDAHKAPPRSLRCYSFGFRNASTSRAGQVGFNARAGVVLSIDRFRDGRRSSWCLVCLCVFARRAFSGGGVPLRREVGASHAVALSPAALTLVSFVCLCIVCERTRVG